jgi:hypothetical protein
MADNPSNGNFTNYGILFATLLSAGALLFPGFPALNTRPRSAEPPVHETASAQDTDARLWQDPFEVVDRALKSARVSTPCPEDLDRYPDHDRHCERPIDQLRKARSLESGENPVVIGVTLSGAPYPEDEEARRQYRYAVLSGLDAVGYVPENARGIGYYRLKPGVDARRDNSPLPTTIPFELFQTRVTGSANKKIVVLWLNEDLAGGRPLLHFCSLLKRLGLETQGMQVVGPRSSDTLRDLVNEANDPERRPDDAPAGCEQTADGLQQSRFYAYSATVEDSALLSALGISNAGSVHKFLETKHIHLFRTVATDDVVAQALVHELKLRGVEPGREQSKSAKPQSRETGKSPPNEQHIALISEWDSFYGQTFPCTLQDKLRASLQDSYGRREGEAPCAKAKASPPWAHKFTYLRGLDGALPGNQQNDPPKNAPGDSQGGSDKDQADKNRADTKSSDLPFGNGQFDYLKRLAGSLRSLQDELLQTDQGGIKAIGVLGVDVFDKLQVLRALKFEFPEAIFFTTDFDETFTAESYRKSTRNLIVASSFGPELARPLQGAIPPFRQSYQTAAFLSTQLAVLDAPPVPPSPDPGKAPTDSHAIPMSYAGPSSIEGAEASSKARAAEPATADGRPPDWPSLDEQDYINRWLVKPPIFEIERSGNPLQLSQHAPGPAVPCEGSQNAKNCDPCDSPQNLRICRDILPPDPPLFPSPDFRVRLGLVIVLAGGFLYAFRVAMQYRTTLKKIQNKSHLHQNPRRLTFADVTYGIYVLLLGLGSSLGVFLLLLGLQWQWFAPRLTGDGEGEPMQLFEGASLWPSIGLRLVTMILSLSFIFVAWAQLDSNINKVARSIRLKTSPRMLINKLNNDRRNSELSLLKKIYNSFIVKSRAGQTGSTVYNIEQSWEQFVFQGRPFARLCRVIFCVGAMFGIATLLFSISGNPGNPGRGDLVRTLYLCFTLIDVLLMYFLIFFVADATLFSFLFVRQLANGPTLWPESTKKFFNKKLGLDHSLPLGEKSGVLAETGALSDSMSAGDRSSTRGEHRHQVLDDWIDLYFIGKRTACINKLIYYPFAIIALMIVSRSAVFGDFPLSKPIIVTWGVCLAIVTGCAIALNHMAEDARAQAQRHLMDEIIKAKGSPESGHSGQWESLLDRVNAMREGAFRPFLQQPIFGAILLPLSSVGWATLLEKGLLGQ